MIVADKFVFVHYPKTGGTFVTSVLWDRAELLGTKEVWVRNPRTWFFKHRMKHGVCRDIPKGYREKPILAVHRNPYDLYVSEYEFGWWKRPELLTHIRRRKPGYFRENPHFPDISFEEFVYLYNSAFCRRPRNRRLDSSEAMGWVTERFIQYYFRRPWIALFKTTDEYIHSGERKHDMFDVRFLRMDNLNQDLYQFLLDLGYSKEDFSFILEKGRVLPQGKGRSANQAWQGYYTPELKKFVRQRERLLFALFPEYDI